MNAALLALMLLAPAPKKHWSKAHHIGVWAPNTWTVAAGKGDRAFVIAGPQMGKGTPQAVLWNAGSADTQSLLKKTRQLAAAVKKRTGWSVVAQKRKMLGPYPAYRIGINFIDEGRKGRARFTVVLMGGFFYVLEMNAAASHFPGPTFDAIEKSLEIPWADHRLEIGVTLRAPRGWSFDAEGPRATLGGPACGVGPPVMRIGAGRMPAAMLKGAKPGPKVTFLGAVRETQLIERTDDELKLRMLHIHHDGLTATLMVPIALWDDMLPTVTAILASVKPPRRDGK